jgi:hypothetical protein
MKMKLDALSEEVDNDTLAKLALATTAGVITTVAARKLYKKYKEKKILNKYVPQENNKHHTIGDELRNIAPDLMDINSMRNLVDAKK